MNTTHENIKINQQAIDAVNLGEEIPEELEIDGEPAFELEYHSTDAWRGYYNAVPIEGSGWEKLDEGWMTGDYDDAPTEARSSSVEEKVNRLAGELDEKDCDLAVVFAPTSNVFSTGYDLFKRQRNG